MAERYRTIVADPPWHQRTGPPNLHVPNGGGSAKVVPYPTLSVAEITELPIEAMTESDAHLYLWTTNRYLEAAYGVARAWGFRAEPGTILVWCKAPKGRGLGETFSVATEFCLFCVRGKQPAVGRIERNWWQWPRTDHSTKPEAFLDLVEQVSPGPYLELFARRARFGWDYWGDESLGTAEMPEKAV